MSRQQTHVHAPTVTTPSLQQREVQRVGSRTEAAARSSRAGSNNSPTNLRFKFGQVAVHAAPLPTVQPKLVVGEVGDVYEQEADRVANQVMAGEPISSPITQNAAGSEQLRHQPEEQRDEDEDDEKDLLQASALPNQTPQVTRSLASQLTSAQGQGQALPSPTRQFFESRFGYDFGQVRVHADTTAATAANTLRARAFTHQQDIFFGHGYYQPETSAGKWLLAHELTHILQRRPGVVSRQEVDIPVAPPQTRLEQDIPLESIEHGIQAEGEFSETVPEEGSSPTPTEIVSAPELNEPPGVTESGATAVEEQSESQPEEGGEPSTEEVASSSELEAEGTTSSEAESEEEEDTSGLAQLATSNLSLIDEELAEHQRWGEAAAQVGEVGSTERAQFIAEAAAAGGEAGFSQGFDMGLAVGAGTRAVEMAVAWGAGRLAARAAGTQAARFTPLPAVGAVIGGALSAYNLASRDWGETGETIGRFGQGASIYEQLANSIAAVSEIIDVATNILNVIAGVIGAISIAMWAITVATVGVASPLAATLSAITVGIGIGTMVLDAINALVLQRLVLLFRALHAFTSQADPRDVLRQGAAISTAANKADGFLGGLVGGIGGSGAVGVTSRGLGRAVGRQRTPPPHPDHPTPSAASGDGPTVTGEPPVEGSTTSTPEGSGSIAGPETTPGTSETPTSPTGQLMLPGFEPPAPRPAEISTGQLMLPGFEPPAQAPSPSPTVPVPEGQLRLPGIDTPPGQLTLPYLDLPPRPAPRPGYRWVPVRTSSRARAHWRSIPERTSSSGQRRARTPEDIAVDIARERVEESASSGWLTEQTAPTLRDMPSDQIAALQEGNWPTRQEYGSGVYQGHHRWSRSAYPEYARDPDLITHVPERSHFWEWHGVEGRGAVTREPTHGSPGRPNLEESYYSPLIEESRPLSERGAYSRYPDVEAQLARDYPELFQPGQQLPLPGILPPQRPARIGPAREASGQYLLPGFEPSPPPSSLETVTPSPVSGEQLLLPFGPQQLPLPFETSPSPRPTVPEQLVLPGTLPPQRSTRISPVQEASGQYLLPGFEPSQSPPPVETVTPSPVSRGQLSLPFGPQQLTLPFETSPSPRSTTETSQLYNPLLTGARVGTIVADGGSGEGERTITRGPTRGEELAAFAIGGPGGLVGLHAAHAAHDLASGFMRARREPVVERVNPNYPAPPCTPQDIIDTQNEILQILDARAQTEVITTIMRRQESQHEDNQQPIRDAQSGTQEAISAVDAHRQAVTRRQAANQQQQQRVGETRSTIESYAGRASELNVIKRPLQGFERFTSLATSLPDSPAVLQGAKRSILRINRDSRNFLSALNRIDNSMAQQRTTQPQRERQIEENASKLSQTADGAKFSGQSLNNTMESTQTIESENENRITTARETRTRSERTTAQLDSQAQAQRSRAETLATSLQAWSRAHRQARLDALRATQERMVQQGYTNIEVRER